MEQDRFSISAAQGLQPLQAKKLIVMRFASMTVGEIAAAYPDATDIFTRYGIDYCCGGRRNFTEATRSRGLDPDQIGREIIGREKDAARLTGKRNPFSIPQIIDQILQYHHAYVRDKRQTLPPLAKKVASTHGGKHPELSAVSQLTENLFDELENHMRKEEKILFPAILALVSHRENGTPLPQVRFQSIAQPIAMMERDHSQTGRELYGLQRITNDFTVPEDGCVSYKELCEKLRDVQAHIFEHLHLENNILFPRALELERTLRENPRDNGFSF